MASVYYQAFQIQEETETAADYHMIVNMIIKYGYNQTLLKIMEV